MPSASAFLARVPKMSSASRPACSMIVIPIARNTSFITGTCSRSSSGMGFRVPLYASYI